jgi:hypothetical protein
MEKAQIAYRLLQDPAGLRSFNRLGSMNKNRFQGGRALVFLGLQEAKEVNADYLQGLAQMNLGTLYHDQVSLIRRKGLSTHL